MSPTRPGAPQAGGASQSRRPLLGFTHFHTRFTSSSQHLPLCTGMAPAHARTEQHPARHHILPLALSAQAPPRPTAPALPQLLRPRPLQTRAGFEVRPLVRASVVARAGIAGRCRAGAAGLRAARAARAARRERSACVCAGVSLTEDEVAMPYSLLGPVAACPALHVVASCCARTRETQRVHDTEYCRMPSSQGDATRMQLLHKNYYHIQGEGA